LRSSDDWRQSPKDIIISGGENTSSIEVEEALYKHPAVQAAAVVASLGSIYAAAMWIVAVPRDQPQHAHTESLLGLWARRAGLFHEGARWCWRRT
jgi:acyl-CoA synthetase (AMP-forming)/AMP-acid ligase II